MISIIIPVYNQAAKLRVCLLSISQQDYTDYEVIIVDDGSSDQPVQIFEACQHLFSQPLQFVSQSNQGANAARNHGRSLAHGQYLLFCDADAELIPTALSQFYQALQAHPEASYVYSNFYYGFKLFHPGSFSADRLRQEPFIHTMSLIRATDFPGFDPALKRFQDWDLWLTILAQGHQGHWLDQALFKITPGGTISSWLPSFVYKLLPWLPAVKAYHQAESIIKHKHELL
jgi:glycosyltransferase involved in cell wall biosynthesis